MKSSIEAAVVRDLEDRAEHARSRRDAYVRGSVKYADFDGRYWAFKDLAKSIKVGEYDPIKGASC